jgi:hypothetical protein
MPIEARRDAAGGSGDGDDKPAKTSNEAAEELTSLER